MSVFPYILLNPLRAKLVKECGGLSAYPYCGHVAVMCRRKVEWQDREYIRRFFGDKETSARRGYSQFVHKGIEQGKRPDLVVGLLRSHGGWAGIRALKESGDYQKGDERILGDGAFVRKCLKGYSSVHPKTFVF